MGKVPVAYRFDGELYAKFKVIVQAEGRSMTWYFERLMRDVVERSEVKVPAKKRRLVKRAHKTKT